MQLPPVIRDAIRLLLVALLEHQYIVLFFVVAIEEAGVPLPAPTDVVIAFYGYRARGDLPELAQVVLVCALASTAGPNGSTGTASSRSSSDVSCPARGWSCRSSRGPRVSPFTSSRPQCS